MENTLENNIAKFLTLVDEDINREGLVDTPKRVAKAWRELLKPEDFNFTVFESNGYDEMIMSNQISYYTFCEHHLLPFFGSVDIGYIPNRKIVGLSKLARTVEYYSKRLNTQEYFTNNIASRIQKELEPKGVGVIVSGRHLCQEMRGIKKQGHMVTSALYGCFRDAAAVRKEFLSLTRGD
jgi:GTP cyclohydrolase I